MSRIITLGGRQLGKSLAAQRALDAHLKRYPMATVIHWSSKEFLVEKAVAEEPLLLEHKKELT